MSNKSFITRSTTGLSVAQEEDVTELQNQINTIDTSLIVIEDKLNDLDISLGLLNNVDNSINKLDISVNFLDLSGVEFSLGISKLDISVNKLEISANKYELYETSFNFLEASGNVFSLDIGNIETSCNIYELSINALETGGGGTELWTGTSDICYNAGNVGIGTTNPANLLHIATSSNPTLLIEDSDITANQARLSFKTTHTTTNPHTWTIGQHGLNSVTLAEAQKFKISENADLNTDTRLTMIKGGRIGIGTTEPEGGYLISGVQSGGQGIEIKYKGTVLPGPTAGSEEYIPLQFTYHQTNYHASSFPRYRFRLDSISASAGLGNGCFSIEHSGSTSASFKAKLLITSTGQLLVNKETARFGSPNGVFCLQSTGGFNGFIVLGEMRNLTQSTANTINDQQFWTALRFQQIINTSSTGANGNFALGITAANNNNYKGQLTLNPYGGNVGVNFDFWWNQTYYKFFVNGRSWGHLWYASSDDRIKYNETSIGSALPIINKLKPYKYEKITSARNQKGIWIPTDASWNEVKNDVDLSGDRLYDYTEEIGFIAQDIRSEINDLSFCVSGEEEDPSGNQTLLGVNYNSIFCLAIQAIQELDKKVNTLENEIKILKGE